LPSVTSKVLREYPSEHDDKPEVLIWILGFRPHDSDEMVVEERHLENEARMAARRGP